MFYKHLVIYLIQYSIHEKQHYNHIIKLTESWDKIRDDIKKQYGKYSMLAADYRPRPREQV